MSPTTIRNAVLNLSAEDRAELLAAIWDSFFTGDDADVPVSRQQIEEIMRRDRELDENPDLAVSYADMRARLRAMKFKGRA
jgi:putative addiction module component (TIGR02574 family)